MKIKIIAVSLFLSLLLAGCSSSEKRKVEKIFTTKDYAALTYCMGLSYSARGIAAHKLKGTSIDDVRKTILKDASTKIKLILLMLQKS